MEERQSYNDLIKDYIGDELYFKATSQKKPFIVPEHEFVSRDIIVEFIKSHLKEHDRVSTPRKITTNNGH